MSGTHRDLLFWSRRRCFACNNHSCGLGSIETFNSGANHATLHAQNDRWSLGPIETCNFICQVAVFKAQNHRWGLVHIETSNSGANHAVLHAQNDWWGLGPIETCNSGPKVAVCLQKTSMRPGTHRDLYFWSKSRCFACNTTDEGWDP